MWKIFNTESKDDVFPLVRILLFQYIVRYSTTKENYEGLSKFILESALVKDMSISSVHTSCVKI